MISTSTTPMFEQTTDLRMIIGGISSLHNNLSVCYLESRNITYASVVHRSQVHFVNYDTKGEYVNWETISVTDANTDKPVPVTQACLVTPNVRALPLLVIGTTQGVQIFDVRTQRMLVQSAIEANPETEMSDGDDWYSFARGITCNDNLILVGNHTGDLMQFYCNGETSLTVKKPIQEHRSPIVDLATCRYDEVTCSADAAGDVIVWTKPVKSVAFKIQTKETITAINVLRKQVIVGTLKGELIFYSLVNGEKMALVPAHSRPITSVAVAPESAYVMSGGEDGRFVVYKLHTRKPNAYQIEYRYSDKIKNGSVAGCQFTNGRGSNIAIACYDKSIIHMYRIVKKLGAP